MQIYDSVETKPDGTKIYIRKEKFNKHQDSLDEYIYTFRKNTFYDVQVSFMPPEEILNDLYAAFLTAYVVHMNWKKNVHDMHMKGIIK